MEIHRSIFYFMVVKTVFKNAFFFIMIFPFPLDKLGNPNFKEMK